MSNTYEINAEVRDTKGKGASRRLRHADKVPAIVYGEGGDSVSITLDHNDIWVKLQQEAFHSHILTLKVGNNSDNVIMRDIQYHPFKTRVMHLDFLRIAMDHALQTSVPVHFINEDIAVGVKQQGGQISHLISDLEIECMPADLPEYVEVDVAEHEIDHSSHLSDTRIVVDEVEETELPEGEDAEAEGTAGEEVDSDSDE